MVAGPVAGVEGEGLVVSAETGAAYLLDAGVAEEDVAGAG